MTEHDWQDALQGPLDVLINTAMIVGVVGIVLSILLLIARSPK